MGTANVAVKSLQYTRQNLSILRLKRSWHHISFFKKSSEYLLIIFNKITALKS